VNTGQWRVSWVKKPRNEEGGGATAVLFGWRNTTVDVDLKLEPEPAGVLEALLVEIAAPRLRSLGLGVPASRAEGDAEIRLYHRLGARGGTDPYSEYNALLRRLTSFVRALEHERRERR
jgi:hypothetical protein